MKTNPIVAQVRAARHQISAEHGHNSRRLLEHYMELQEEAKKSGKYRFVTGFFSTGPENAPLEKSRGGIALAPANLRVRTRLKAKTTKRETRHRH